MQYRRSLASSFFFKFYLNVSQSLIDKNKVCHTAFYCNSMIAVEKIFRAIVYLFLSNICAKFQISKRNVWLEWLERRT